MPKQCNYSNCTNPVFSRGRCRFHLQPKTDATGEKKVKAAITPTFKNKARIKPVSDKQGVLNREYSKLAKLFKIANPICKALLPGCKLYASDVHHKAGRGENLLKVSTWLPVCRSCHNWIEANPTASKELGFSESRLNK